MACEAIEDGAVPSLHPLILRLTERTLGYEPRSKRSTRLGSTYTRECSNGRMQVSKTLRLEFESLFPCYKLLIIKSVAFLFVYIKYFRFYLDKTIFFRIFVKNHAMQLIRVKKKTNGKLDQAKTILSIFCLLSGINLSDTELTVLSYFLVYKVNDVTKKLILNGKILKSEDSLKNTISKLKKFGLLKKSNVNKEYVVNEEVNVPMDDVVGFLIKVDNK